MSKAELYAHAYSCECHLSCASSILPLTSVGLPTAIPVMMLLLIFLLFLQHRSYQYWIGSINSKASVLVLSINTTSLEIFLWKKTPEPRFKAGAAGSGSKYAIHCAMLPHPIFDLLVLLQNRPYYHRPKSAICQSNVQIQILGEPVFLPALFFSINYS